MLKKAIYKALKKRSDRFWMGMAAGGSVKKANKAQCLANRFK